MVFAGRLETALWLKPFVNNSSLRSLCRECRDIRWIGKLLVERSFGMADDDDDDDDDDNDKLFFEQLLPMFEGIQSGKSLGNALFDRVIWLVCVSNDILSRSNHTSYISPWHRRFTIPGYIVPTESQSMLTLVPHTKAGTSCATWTSFILPSSISKSQLLLSICCTNVPTLNSPFFPWFIRFRFFELSFTLTRRPIRCVPSPSVTLDLGFLLDVRRWVVFVFVLLVLLFLRNDELNE